jgi:hypothetical protein
MRLRAPIIAAVLLGSAVALVWFGRDEPVNVVAENASPPAVAVELPGADDVRPPGDEALPSFSPAPQERAADATAVAAAEPPRVPLPGEVPVTPMVQLFADGPPAERERAANMREHEREFAAESIDASWAQGAENDIFAKVAQIPGLRLVDLGVECRSTMCLLQMTHTITQPAGAPATSGPPFLEVVRSIGLEPRWMLTMRDRYGTGRSLAYVWREGLAPPRPVLREEQTDDDN